MTWQHTNVFAAGTLEERLLGQTQAVLFDYSSVIGLRIG